VAWLQSITRLPVLLKGVLHPDDARQAAALGVAGSSSATTAGARWTRLCHRQALPRIAEALRGEPALLVDGGIRRGTDVLKALALGAAPC
jgi:4-hydroxymandelate oxidase